MSLKKASAIILMASSLLSLSAAAESLRFKNQRGSTLELNLLADNKISGYFTTAVASKTCPDAIGQKRPITGYAAGNVITFSVVYPMCGSVVSIIGNFDKEQKIIDTLSIVNHQSEDITHEGPGARFIGHDTYKKTI